MVMKRLFWRIMYYCVQMIKLEYKKPVRVN